MESKRNGVMLRIDDLVSETQEERRGLTTIKPYATGNFLAQYRQLTSLYYLYDQDLTVSPPSNTLLKVLGPPRARLRWRLPEDY